MTSGTRQAGTSPRATYRLQFSPGFTIAQGTAILPYLAALGVSHVYVSPLLKSRAGSSHGYDITDHNSLNPELGSPDDYERFFAALRRLELGLVLDFVPNHMGIGAAENGWWLDLLEWGQGSIYAEYFDIEWHPRQATLQGRVLLPLLGDHYGKVLERGELGLRFDVDSGSFSIWYYGHRLPVRLRDYAAILRRRLAEQPDLPPELGRRFDALATEFDRLRRPARSRQAQFRAAAAAAKAELASLARNSADARDLLEAAANGFNGTAGAPASFRALHHLLERQHYRLAYWRVAADEINYRRFFNVNDLAGIRMEVPALFEEAHRLVAALIGDGKLQGLRLDHIDGLYDPAQYLERLQSLASVANGGRPFYVLIEKILARRERLRESWPVAGTTGYEFIDLATHLFVDPAGETDLDRAYRQCLGHAADFDAIIAASKDRVIDDELASELHLLAHRLDRLSEQHWGTRDYTLERLHAALKAIVMGFPVYRTYVDRAGAGAPDRRTIDEAVGRAKRRWHGPDIEVLDFVRSLLTTDIMTAASPYRPNEVLRFAMQFQQYTGPVMAKSCEDTAFYRYNRLIALNEVGGDPRSFGLSTAAFHQAIRDRAMQWPEAMLTTATHDTKRGEDARLRITALSELARPWRQAMPRWRRMNSRFVAGIEGEAAPSPNDEYLIYQSLIGFWPVASESAGLPEPDRRRFGEFLVKALREAKLHTSWDNPRPAYEEACLQFVERLLAPDGNPFLPEFVAFAGRAAFFGMLASLGQTVLKLTLPGVPDIYQGTELWDESLVDPDNRRPVDFVLRHRLLLALEGEDRDSEAPMAGRLLASWRDGRIKLHVLKRLLALRREHEEIFREADYLPLAPVGTARDNLLAFARRTKNSAMIVLVGRWLARLTKPEAHRYDNRIWGDTAIATPGMAGRWRDALTGRQLDIASEGENARIVATEALAHLPVAVLQR
ncbi:MAG: malto-oligosyltrehalose synthase [Dongiaceae bacterium]